MATATDRPARPAREDLLRRLDPLVRRMAMRVGRVAPDGVTVSDLVAAGWAGLLDARREVLRDARYAEQRARGGMLDFLKSRDPDAVAMRRASRRIAEAIAEHTSRVGTIPDEDEVAAALGLDVVAYRATLGAVADAGMARLEIIDFDELVERGPAGPERPLERSLADALEALPHHMIDAVALRVQEGCSVHEIGAILGVGPRRAKELVAEAMHYLRAALGRT